MPVFFEVPVVTYLLFWLLSQLFVGTLAGLGPGDVGGIAWWAHVGGFGAGALVYRLFVLPKSKRSRPFEQDECGLEGAW